MRVRRNACGGTHFLAVQALFSKSSSFELYLVPIAMLALLQRLFIAKLLILSAESEVSYSKSKDEPGLAVYQVKAVQETHQSKKSVVEAVCLSTVFLKR